MAVLDPLPGLAVSVSVASNELREFEYDEQGSYGIPANKNVCRYIESTSDAEFEINIQLSPPFQLDCAGLKFQVYIDGAQVAGRVCKKSSIKNDHWTCKVSGRLVKGQDGEAELRKFKFAAVRTVEEGNVLRVKNDVLKFSHVGQIKVKVFRLSYYIKSKRELPQNVNELTSTEVAEKAMKGRSLSNCLAYSAPVPTSTPVVYDTTYLDGNDKPIVIFEFRYLSKAALQQQLIIPRSPSPDPYSALTDVEKERLARQKFLELQVAKIKVEVKDEKGSKRKRNISFGGIETIDLSGETPASNLSARRFKTTKMTNGNEAIDLTD